MSWPTARAIDGGIDELPVAGVPGRLWLCGKHVVGPDPQAALLRVGASAIVCLNEEHELTDRYPDYVGWLRSERTGRATWHPIHDLGAPPLEDALRLIGVLHERLQAGDGVVMHCAAGFGRTGTIASGLLVVRGAGAVDALRAVATARPMAGPEAGVQRALVDAIARRRDRLNATPNGYLRS